MLAVLVNAALIYSLSFLCWRLLRRSVVASPLALVPGPPSASYLKGNFGQLFNFDAWKFHRHLSEQYGSVVKVHGLLNDQQLFLSDPKALHHVLVKDVDTFEPIFIERNRLVFGWGLLSTLGDHHRKQRKMLNPVFATKHIRELLPVFRGVAEQLRDALAAQLAAGPGPHPHRQEIDVLAWSARTAQELIGQGGLGHSFGPLAARSTDRFGEAAKAIIPAMFDIALLQRAIHFLARLGPPRVRRALLARVPLRKVQRVRAIADAMWAVSGDIFRAKKAAAHAHAPSVAGGRDIMSALLHANMAADPADRLPDEELIGQMTTLMFAATDTTSGALAHILQLLAEHPAAQARLRAELVAAGLAAGAGTYEKLQGLPYLDAVVRETLRLHPPVTFIPRIARKDTTLPLSRPLRLTTGAHVAQLPLARGTHVLVSIVAANRDPAVWGADAHAWRPERWLAPLPESVGAAHLPGIYSKMMTFLGGGRACIGVKFAELELKTVLATLVPAFAFAPPAPGTHIVWNLAPVQFPTVRGAPGLKAALPLTLAMIGGGGGGGGFSGEEGEVIAEAAGEEEAARC